MLRKLSNWSCFRSRQICDRWLCAALRSNRLFSEAETRVGGERVLHLDQWLKRYPRLRLLLLGWIDLYNYYYYYYELLRLLLLPGGMDCERSLRCRRQVLQLDKWFKRYPCLLVLLLGWPDSYN